MILTPHEILQKLGFNVPPEGVRINSNDAFLHDSVLRIAGKTLNLAAAPDTDFERLHRGMAGIISAQRNEPQNETDAKAIALTRLTATTVLAQTYGRSPAVTAGK